jgi:hypothetical protein
MLPGFLRKGAVAISGIYLCTTTLGCAPVFVNNAKIYDPDPKANKKIWAAADNVKTDANTGEQVAWYKTPLGIIGIAATVIIIGTVAGFAIYNHNKKDADAPAHTPDPPPPPPTL